MVTGAKKQLLLVCAECFERSKWIEKMVQSEREEFNFMLLTLFLGSYRFFFCRKEFYVTESAREKRWISAARSKLYYRSMCDKNLWSASYLCLFERGSEWGRV